METMLKGYLPFPRFNRLRCGDVDAIADAMKIKIKVTAKRRG